MSGLTIYTLRNCDTCRRAVQWLQARRVVFDEKPVRETPPGPDELAAMLVAQGGEVRRLFNTAGAEYRALKLGDRLDGMDQAAALG